MVSRIMVCGVAGLGLLACMACGGAPAADPAPFDVVIAGGRVMDPETGLDAIRHVGIRDGSIVAVSETALGSRLSDGGTRIDAAGLVVAPGFIDLHAHGMSDEAFKYRARDGRHNRPRARGRVSLCGRVARLDGGTGADPLRGQRFTRNPPRAVDERYR